MIFVSWVTMTGKMFISWPPPQKHQSHLPACSKEEFKNPTKSSKEEGYFMCATLHITTIFFIYLIAALILNGQNNFSPAMKMCKT